MASSERRRTTRGGFAVLISLALHAGMVGVLVQVPRPSGDTVLTDCAGVDACTLDTEPAEGRPAFLVPRPAPSRVAAAAPSPVFVAELTPEPFPVGTPVAPPVIQASHRARAGDSAAPLTAAGVRETGSEPGEPGHSAGPTTGRCGTSFFQVGVQAQTLVYVIDRSSSMGLHGALAEVRQQVLTSLEHLPPRARFQVIVFNRTAEPLLAAQPGLMSASPENLLRVAAQLSTLTAEGGTDHLPALRRALALHPDVIFFLTDADDLTAGDLRAVSRLNSGRHTIIHAIELNTRNRDRLDMPMHLLARDNRGTYQAVALPNRP